MHSSDRFDSGPSIVRRLHRPDDRDYERARRDCRTYEKPCVQAITRINSALGTSPGRRRSVPISVEESTAWRSSSRLDRAIVIIVRRSAGLFEGVHVGPLGSRLPGELRRVHGGRRDGVLPPSIDDEIAALRAIVEGTARSTGEVFFESLVRHLAPRSG